MPGVVACRDDTQIQMKFKPAEGVAMSNNLNAALQTLRHIMGDECENFTSGLGSCYEAGRSPGAEYSSDRCCVNCIAHRFLTCGEVPREERHIDLETVNSYGKPAFLLPR
jgi:hypothetical protein